MKDREFGLIKNTSALSENYKRLVSDTTPNTRATYQKRFAQWMRTIKGFADFRLKINEIDSKWTAGKYRHATVRQYKATAVYALSVLYEIKMGDADVLDDDVGVFEQLAKKLTVNQLNDLYDLASDLGSEGERKELDHKAHLEGNTSSMKDKRFNPKLMQAVLDYCGDEPRYWLLTTFLKLNSKLGLRPIEYKDATLINLKYFTDHEEVRGLFGVKSSQAGNDLSIHSSIDSNKSGLGAKSLLIVKNAKNSHGRACGDYRFLVLNVLDDGEFVQLVKMLAKLRKLHSSVDDFNKQVIRPMQEKLKYVLDKDAKCKKIVDSLHLRKMRDYRFDVKSNPNRRRPLKKRPTIYSTRHQAIANAKKEGIHPVVIAAAFGHASILSAEEHYGIHWHGSGRAVVPNQYSVDAVVERLTVNQRAQIIRQSQEAQVSEIQGNQKALGGGASLKRPSLNRGS